MNVLTSRRACRDIKLCRLAENPVLPGTTRTTRYRRKVIFEQSPGSLEVSGTSTTTLSHCTETYVSNEV
eukprot:588314-Amorphochlora_amoeboformis.AAC.1